MLCNLTVTCLADIVTMQACIDVARIFAARMHFTSKVDDDLFSRCPQNQINIHITPDSTYIGFPSKFRPHMTYIVLVGR